MEHCYRRPVRSRSRRSLHPRSFDGEGIHSNRARDVLQFLWAQILEGEVEFGDDILIDPP